MDVKDMNLTQRISAITGQIEKVSKDGKMTDGPRYNFARDVDVYAAVRPLLAEYEVAIFPALVEVTQTEQTTSTGKTTYHSVGRFEFTVSCPVGDPMVMSWFSEANDNSDKGVNKLSAAALKYFLMRLFMIETGNDDPDEERIENGRGGRSQSFGSGKTNGQPRRIPAPQPAPTPEAEVKTLPANRVMVEQHGKQRVIVFNTAGGDKPRLYNREAIRALGGDWPAFAETLEPRETPYDLPQEVMVDYERKVKDDGEVYYMVKKLHALGTTEPALEF